MTKTAEWTRSCLAEVGIDYRAIRKKTLQKLKERRAKEIEEQEWDAEFSVIWPVLKRSCAAMDLDVVETMRSLQKILNIQHTLEKMDQDTRDLPVSILEALKRGETIEVVSEDEEAEDSPSVLGVEAPQ